MPTSRYFPKPASMTYGPRTVRLISMLVSAISLTAACDPPTERVADPGYISLERALERAWAEEGSGLDPSDAHAKLDWYSSNNEERRRVWVVS